MIRLILIVLIFGVAACASTVQTTSGAEFLARSGPVDPDIAAVAAVEPDLRFPARIGIARVVNGQVTLPPPDERALFDDAFQITDTYGAFVVVNPQLFDLVLNTPLPVAADGRAMRIDTVTHKARLIAARQHLDYVLIYEVGARGRRARLPYGLTDIEGASISMPDAQATGIGRALFVDVRNGYAYAALQVDRDLAPLRGQYRVRNRKDAARQAAALLVTEALVPEVVVMMSELASRAR